MREVGIIVPVYNEESIVDEVLKELIRLYGDMFEIIVVDDGSSDNSYEAACLPGIHLLRHMINLGQGAALQTGIEYARKIGCKYVVTFDSDGQHDPRDIIKIVDILLNKNVDIVLCSRFLTETKDIPRSKKIILFLGRIFTYLTTGLWLTDTHNGLRGINIAKFPQFEIRQNRMAHASEILQLVKKLKMRYEELPCVVYYTTYSKQKGQSIWNSINIILDYFLGEWVK